MINIDVKITEAYTMQKEPPVYDLVKQYRSSKQLARQLSWKCFQSLYLYVFSVYRRGSKRDGRSIARTRGTIHHMWDETEISDLISDGFIHPTAYKLRHILQICLRYIHMWDDTVEDYCKLQYCKLWSLFYSRLDLYPELWNTNVACLYKISAGILCKNQHP